MKTPGIGSGGIEQQQRGLRIQATMVSRHLLPIARLRAYIVEPVFGLIKAARGIRQLGFRGIDNVKKARVADLLRR